MVVRHPGLYDDVAGQYAVKDLEAEWGEDGNGARVRRAIVLEPRKPAFQPTRFEARVGAVDVRVIAEGRPGSHVEVGVLAP